ncbi:MAG: TetR/AcrR family transcriptional regulator [Myxococcales bacterium]|nr:TetR/AcrR family transcriptional regulator [Myxococcales bacterium]
MTRAGIPQVTRRALLDAVISIYLEHGYDGTSINVIAHRAGLTTGAVYANFKNKDDLLITLLEEQAEQVISTLTERIRAAETLSDRLTVILDWYSNRLHREPLGARLTFDLLRRSYDNPEVRERLAKIYHRAKTIAAEALTNELQTHEITPPMSPYAYAGLAMALIDGIVMQQLIFNDNKVLDDLREVLHLLGLLPTATPAPR